MLLVTHVHVIIIFLLGIGLVIRSQRTNDLAWFHGQYWLESTVDFFILSLPARQIS